MKRPLLIKGEELNLNLDLKSIKTITLREGEKLVFVVPANVGSHDIEQFSDYLNNFFGKGVCLVVSGDVKVSKIVRSAGSVK